MSHPALDAFGDLDAAAADPHVAGCERCRADLAAQQEVRALLAGLPDPGPVPEDVVERIETTLRQLAAAEPLPTATPAAPEPDGQRPVASSTVVPLEHARSARAARRRHPLLAAAAAALVVAGGGYGLAQVLPGRSDDAAAGAAASIADRSKQAGGSAGPAGGSLTSIASGQDYHRADLAAEVDQTLASAGRRSAAAPTGPLSSPVGVAACVSALGAGAVTPLLVDVARFEGRPAAVVVLPTTEGGREIWVVSTTCAPGRDGTTYFTTAR